MRQQIYAIVLIVFAAACGKNEEPEIRQTGLEANIHGNDFALKDFIFYDYTTENPLFLQGLGMHVSKPENLKVGLGRVLFYDKNLSKDRSVSCSSCHKPQYAFGDNVARSQGVEGRITSRNTPALENVPYFAGHYSQVNGKAPLLFWDTRAINAHVACKNALADPAQMGIDMDEVLQRIKSEYYYELFWKKVYQNFEPTEAQVLECLQAFIGIIGNYGSNLDFALAAVAGKDTPNGTIMDTLLLRQLFLSQSTSSFVNPGGLSLSEDRGRAIFVRNCNSCHSPVRTYQEVFSACNGLDINYLDKGLGLLTSDPADEGVFKVPSLRNLAFTAPYMHDGRFKTLQEVVDFYSEGVQARPNLHPLLKHNGDPNLHLSADEKNDLIAFLMSMSNLPFDERLSDPF